MLDNYVLLFKVKLGMIKEVTVKLQVNKSVPPMFFKTRNIPFALKGKVETEQESLEVAGLVSPIGHSNWAAPIVSRMVDFLW